MFHNSVGGYTGIGRDGRKREPGIPNAPALYGSFPNPASDRTCLSYAVGREDKVLMQIYNIRGQLVKTLVNKRLPVGYYDIEWNGTDQKGAAVASGSYFYRLRVGNFVETRRMIWMR